MTDIEPSALRGPRLLLLMLMAASVLTLACGERTAQDDPEAAAAATGNSEVAASLSRRDLEPLLQAARTRPEDLPGTW